MEKFQIPQQQDGKQLDLRAVEHYESEAATTAAYQQARNRLLDVNNWHIVAGSATSARFTLCDGFANEITGNARIGDYVKIDIPGPGSFLGDGFDWVRITLLEELKDAIRITLQPTAMPKTTAVPEKMEQNISAHFFNRQASSTFTLCVQEHKLIVRYYGRNEQINLQSTNILEKIRNSAVGVAAKLGFSSPQWEKLTKGFLRHDT
ncbi:hypothetical protein [Sphingobacterium sp. LRF_L2]|uniref:hypothetical protein n=1 Tax=Sphingobacterium sp. LRF_L2 TaxID=3369421 RepID=UPI003F610C89